MNFERVELFRYQLALHRRVRIGKYVNYAHPGILLCLVDEQGVKGWGDVSPLMGLSRESLADAEASLKATLRKLRGQKFPDDVAVLDALDPVLAQAVPSVRCGLEMAALNLAAENRGIPLHRLWLDKDVPSLPVSALLTGTTEEILGDAAVVRAAAYTNAKLKVGSHPIRDEIDRVRRVHEALGPGVRLRIDANRAWKLDEAVAFAEGVRGLPIDYLEEPMDVPLNIPAFHGETGMAVALDETLMDTPYSTWSAFAGVTAIVVKPTVLGGFRKVSRLAEQARRSNLVVVTSSVYESGIGIMALAHAAAVWGGPDVPAGVGTYRSVDWDVLAPRLPMEGAALPLPALNMKNHAIDRGTLLSL